MNRAKLIGTVCTKRIVRSVVFTGSSESQIANDAAAGRPTNKKQLTSSVVDHEKVVIRIGESVSYA